MPYVFCVSGGSVLLGPIPVQLVVGRAYAADDPIVRQYPHMFSDTPIVYDAFGTVVEQASADPGARRAVKRG